MPRKRMDLRNRPATQATIHFPSAQAWIPFSSGVLSTFLEVLNQFWPASACWFSFDMPDAVKKDGPAKDFGDTTDNPLFINSSLNLHQVRWIVDIFWSTQPISAGKRLWPSFWCTQCCEKGWTFENDRHHKQQSTFLQRNLDSKLHRLIVGNFRNICPIFAQTVLLASLWSISIRRKELRFMWWWQHNRWASFRCPTLKLHPLRLIVNSFRSTHPIFAQTVFLASSW